MRRGRLIASIDLPKETFAVSGGVNNPSVLIIQKFTDEERKQANAGIMDKNHTVFMSAPRTSGIDKRGNQIFLRHPDGRQIVDEDGNRFLDDEVASIPEHFVRWWDENRAV